MERMIIVRDGSGGFSYIGECDLPEQEIINTRVAGGMVKLTNVRILMTLMGSAGPGLIAQEIHVFPLDGEFGPTEVWAFPSSFHYPTEVAAKHLLKLIKKSEENEVRLRAKHESGLAV